MWKPVVAALIIIAAGALVLFRAPMPPSPEASVTPLPVRSPAVTEPDIPLPRARERVTRKPFGIRVRPDDSPVSPERFSGYHTGADFELLPGEDETTLTVRALCVGPVIDSRRISGYGGVVVQRCTLLPTPFTVLYGHLAPASLPGIGTELTIGQAVGTLGRGYSSDTDGERPHLHLGITSGTAEDVRGYVTDSGQLRGWLDPLRFIP
jgi:hypothetical protein